MRYKKFGGRIIAKETGDIGKIKKGRERNTHVRPESQSIFKLIRNKLLKKIISSTKHGGAIVGVLLLLLLIFELILFFYFVIPNIILPIWNWGEQVWYQGIIAIIVEFFIITIYFGVILPIRSITKVIAIYTETPEEKRIDEGRQKIDEVERKIRESLKEDELGTFDLITYRRTLLNYYYDMNFKQTKKSFRYSIFAMFLGFFIILTGIAGAFGFLDIVFPNIKLTDINNVVIAGGVLAEMISALFLWIYKASSEQLIYFYKRQIQAHNAFLSFKIATSMNNPIRDKTKQEIVKGILETSVSDEPSIKLPTTNGIRKFLKIKP